MLLGWIRSKCVLKLTIILQDLNVFLVKVALSVHKYFQNIKQQFELRDVQKIM